MPNKAQGSTISDTIGIAGASLLVISCRPRLADLLREYSRVPLLAAS
jgi:hypothetical protein